MEALPIIPEPDTGQLTFMPLFYPGARRKRRRTAVEALDAVKHSHTPPPKKGLEYLHLRLKTRPCPQCDAPHKSRYPQLCRKCKRHTDFSDDD